MNAAFQIPSLSSRIPATLVQHSGFQVAVDLARCLLDAGIIHGPVPARCARDPIATCQRFLTQWLRERLPDLKCLLPTFRLLVGEPSPYFSHAHAGEAGKVTVVWFAESATFAVGQALERMEAIQPGLGATVLSVIDRSNMKLLPTFTPWDTLGTARDFIWYGDDDESTVLDEACGDEPGERAAMQNEMVTRAKIDAAFPKWATEGVHCRKRLRRGTLCRIAASAVSAKVRKVARVALALDRLELDPAFQPDADGWFVGYGAVLTWKPDDITVRVFDDFCNAAAEGDCVDWVGDFTFHLHEPQALRGWMEAMAVKFEGIRLLDTLIHELSSGDWRRVPKGIR